MAEAVPCHTESQPAGDLIDFQHLGRYTLGLKSLEAEVLTLFVEQLPVTLGFLGADASPEDWKYGTHTLKGAARAVGAVRLAAAAATAEKAAPQDRSRHADELRKHVNDLTAFIGGHLAREAGRAA